MLSLSLGLAQIAHVEARDMNKRDTHNSRADRTAPRDASSRGNANSMEKSENGQARSAAKGDNRSENGMENEQHSDGRDEHGMENQGHENDHEQHEMDHAADKDMHDDKKMAKHEDKHDRPEQASNGGQTEPQMQNAERKNKHKERGMKTRKNRK